MPQAMIVKVDDPAFVTEKQSGVVIMPTGKRAVAAFPTRKSRQIPWLLSITNALDAIGR
jgi:hypothetical protein